LIQKGVDAINVAVISAVALTTAWSTVAEIDMNQAPLF